MAALAGSVIRIVQIFTSLQDMLVIWRIHVATLLGTATLHTSAHLFGVIQVHSIQMAWLRFSVSAFFNGMTFFVRQYIFCFDPILEMESH